MLVTADDPAFVPDSLWAAISSEPGIQDPFPHFRALGDVPACSHAVAALALKDSRFSVGPPPDIDRPLWRTFGRFLIMCNPPKHTAIRRLIARAFTKTAVEAYRPYVQRTIDQLLDELEPLGEMDLSRQFAFRLPTAVIAELMQLPDAFRERLDELLIDLDLAFVHQGQEDYLARGDRAVEELLARFGAILDERRLDPGNDLLSRMVKTAGDEIDGEVDRDDLLANAVLLLQAGHDTTMNTLTSGMYELLKHPDQMDRLRADPTLVPAAVEEMLRYHSAIGIAPRTAREDVELAQGTVRAGSKIPFFLGAVNRDPAVFEDPDRFDVARANNPHLAFAAGPHRCVGAPLARLELQMALTAILQRLPQLRLVEEPRWTGVVPFRGLDALNVAW